LQSSDEAVIDGVTMQDAINSQSGMTEAFTDHPISPETVGEISVLSSNYEPQYGVTGQGRAKVTDDWAGQLYRPAHEGGETVAIKAIPCCVWGNRGQQEMKVWIDTTE